MRKVTLLVVLLNIAFVSSCKNNTTSSKNTAPIASFTITPESDGTPATVFTFDANNSTDNEDKTSSLKVRWDWNNDDLWDTDYTTNKTATHQYSTVGTHTIKLEVKDSGGLNNSTTKTITISIQFSGTVTDIDGNIYNAIQVGNQHWMAENLKVTHYNNGDLIPNETGITEWINLSSGAYCSYDNDDSYKNTYGLYYNWYAVIDVRGLAPAGWHIPSDTEWKQLEMSLGMSQSEVDDVGNRGMDEGGKLKEGGTTHWLSPNWQATNSSGFSAIPVGAREEGSFDGVGYSAYFWSSTAYWARMLGFNNSSIYRFNADGQDGFSVRCIKD